MKSLVKWAPIKIIGCREKRKKVYKMFSQATVFANIRVGNFLAYNVVCETMLLKGSLFKNVCLSLWGRRLFSVLNSVYLWHLRTKSFFKFFFSDTKWKREKWKLYEMLKMFFTDRQKSYFELLVGKMCCFSVSDIFKSSLPNWPKLASVFSDGPFILSSFYYFDHWLLPIHIRD